MTGSATLIATFPHDMRPNPTSRLTFTPVCRSQSRRTTSDAVTGEQSISAPELSAKIKRGARAAVEAEIAKALEKLEQEEASADELKKAQLGVKRAM